MNIKKPESISDKIKLARQLHKELRKIMDKKKEMNWEEGKILYYFDRYNLYDFLMRKHISKFEAWKEMGIPPSTAQFKIALYDFYIAQHHFPLEELKEASEKKLHRAIPLIKNESKETIQSVIEEAKNSKERLDEFRERIK